MARYQFGFEALAGQIPDIVGEPLEDEHHEGNGDAQQATTNGLLAWRKSDNWTAFTNGWETWVSGPNGIERRLNTERFPWEADEPQFKLGFAVLAKQIPNVVGQSLEDEHWEANGDSLQGTTNGVLVYRKSSNTAAFTNGDHTWLLGPNGLQDRGNDARFAWEPDSQPPAADYQPKVVRVPIGNENYPFLKTPLGFLLHGTRSGVTQSAEAEWNGTVGYASRGTNGIDAWNYTTGPGLVAVHLTPDRWGWHARGCSRYYVSIESAQGTAAQGIDDETVKAICWCVQDGRKIHPGVPLNFPTHGEVDGTPQYGYHDGKSDVFPRGDVRSDELRGRIMSRLQEMGIS